MNRPDRDLAQRLGSERGVVLYAVALMMVVFLGVAAMALRVGCGIPWPPATCYTFRPRPLTATWCRTGGTLPTFS